MEVEVAYRESKIVGLQYDGCSVGASQGETSAVEIADVVPKMVARDLMS